MSDLPDCLELIGREVTHCRRCPRLVAWRERVGVEKRKAFRDQQYWAKPVPGFGDSEAKVMLLGLAPGAHGSNRTGRMFTGDDSGRFLYSALYRAGFASQPEAIARDDGLTIKDLWITAVCRCVPPDNKPAADEIENCKPFLMRELHCFPNTEGIVAFGKIAYDSALKITGRYQGAPVFGHGVFYPPINGAQWILASYHPSRQNTQTGRLTPSMFDTIWDEVKRLLVVS